MSLFSFKRLALDSRSIRNFSEEIVPDHIIQDAIFSATQAPSSSNMQPWQFVWVKSEAAKARISKICLSQRTTQNASSFVIVLARVDRWKETQQHILTQLNSLDETSNPDIALAKNYYTTVVPQIYDIGLFGIKGIIRRLNLSFKGLFKPVFRVPFNKSGLFKIAVKSCSMAAQNLMLHLQSEGYDCCPMEGFDEIRLSKELSLTKNFRPILVVAIGKRNSQVLIPKIRNKHEDLLVII